MKKTISILVIAVSILLAVSVTLLWQEMAIGQEQSQTASIVDSFNSSSESLFLESGTRSNYYPIRDFTIEEPIITAKSAIVYDINSSRVLFAKNSTDRLPIASITKVMTAVVVKENIDLNKTYIISAEDLNVDGSGPDFKKGEEIKGLDLMKFMLIESSNDAANAFVHWGDNEGIDILELMNKKAEELDMFNTHFNDPAGLDDNSTYSSARDLVNLFVYIERYPDIMSILRTSSTDVQSLNSGSSYHLINTNRLLNTISGIIGGKTGNTQGALGTLSLIVDSGNGNDYIISIVLGTGDRFGETKKLISWVKKAHTWSQ